MVDADLNLPRISTMEIEEDCGVALTRGRAYTVLVRSLVANLIRDSNFFVAFSLFLSFFFFLLSIYYPFFASSFHLVRSTFARPCRITTRASVKYMKEGGKWNIEGAREKKRKGKKKRLARWRSGWISNPENRVKEARERGKRELRRSGVEYSWESGMDFQVSALAYVISADGGSRGEGQHRETWNSHW